MNIDEKLDLIMKKLGINPDSCKSPEELQKIILNDYSDLKIKRYKGKEFDDRSWTDLEKQTIYYYYTDYDNPSYNSIFDLLHEIGHIKTNKIGMSRYKMELLATQWAIEKMKYYDFVIPNYDKDEWHEYIKSFNKKGRFKLNWED